MIKYIAAFIMLCLIPAAYAYSPPPTSHISPMTTIMPAISTLNSNNAGKQDTDVRKQNKQEYKSRTKEALSKEEIKEDRRKFNKFLFILAIIFVLILLGITQVE